MRKFVINTLWFLLPLLIGMIALEVLLRQIPNDYKFKKEYLDEHAGTIETLILGNSHVYRGLNPEYFSSVTFNAAYVSQTFTQDYEIFNKYYNDFKNLKTLIISVSYPSYYFKLELTPELWRNKNYVIYYQMKTAHSLTDYFELLSNKTKINYVKLTDYYFKNQSQLTTSELGFGSYGDKVSSQNLEESGKKHAIRHSNGRYSIETYIKTFDENLFMLESMIQQCKEKGINVVLLTTPTYHTYYENIKPEQLDIIKSTSLELASKYNNCSYLNLLEAPEFTEEDFYDADHLSELGAQKLSLIINDEIEQL